VVKKPEIWTFESYLEKAHVGFELEITRTAGCLKGSFTGKGTIKTQKDQAVTAQGTFLDGDLVMVLSCKGMYLIGKKKSAKILASDKSFCRQKFMPTIFLPPKIFKSFAFYCYFWRVTKISAGFYSADFFAPTFADYN
jgi:hypothetical protein